jgi:uncharacterized protein (TIGR02118 family)
MFRMLIFLKRRPDLDRPAFFDWWLERHRPLAEALPGLQRYVISLAVDAADGAFDGLAELWFDDAQQATAAFASQQGRAARADAEAYTSRIERLPVVEYPFVDTGANPRFKFVAALKRRPGLDRTAFKSWWLEHHAPMVVEFPELSRYQVSLVREDEVEEGFADGVAEVCFNDLETLRRVMSSQQVKTVQEDSVPHTIHKYRFHVEEHHII